MKKLTALALILVLLVSASGCGVKVRRKDSDGDPMITSERDSAKSTVDSGKYSRNDRDDSGVYLNDLLNDIFDDYGAGWDGGWSDEPGREDGWDYGPGKNDNSNEFFHFTSEEIFQWLLYFREFECRIGSARKISPKFTFNISFSLAGEETVEGQKTRHYACKYYEERSDGFTDEEQVEVWVNEDGEPVQALADGELATGQEVLRATNELNYWLTMLNDSAFFGVYNEKELEEHLKGNYTVDKSSRETRDFGFGPVEVTRYELSRFIDMEMFDYSRTDYEKLEYAKIGPQLLVTLLVHTSDEDLEMLEEFTVIKAIPY